MTDLIKYVSPSEQDTTTIDKINTMMVMYEIKGFHAKFMAVSKGSARPYKLICGGRSYGKNYSDIDKLLQMGQPPIRHFESAERLNCYVQKNIFDKSIELKRNKNV